jgi:hypothetical protein
MLLSFPESGRKVDEFGKDVRKLSLVPNVNIGD